MKNLIVATCLLFPFLTTAQNVGINNDNPQGRLHINGGDIIVASDTGFGTNRMHFLVGRGGAFRVGQRAPVLFEEGQFTDQWNGTSVGLASFAANQATIASGNASTAFGSLTRALGQYAFATGRTTLAVGELTMVQGLETVANSFASIAMGRWNVNEGSNTSWITTDPLLTIGNGTSNANRHNALTLLKDGRLGLNTNDPSYWITLQDVGLGIHRPTVNTMAFMANGEERMRINSVGRIGMGTASPAYLLHLRGPDDPNTGAVIALMGNSGDQQEAGRIRFLDGTGSTNWRGAYIHYNALTDRLSLGTHHTTDNIPENDVDAITILRGTRHVGFGTNSPSERLDVDGNARFRSIGSGASAGALNRTSNGTLTTATSDARLKTDIVPIENALQKAMGMRGVTFRWLQDPALGQCIGFIAQEVEKVAPELVFTNEVDGLKGVHYPETTALLLEALRQQQEMIEALKTRIEVLEKKQ